MVAKLEVKKGLATASVAEYRTSMYKLGRHKTGEYEFDTVYGVGEMTLKSVTEDDIEGIGAKEGVKKIKAKLPSAHHRDLLDAIHACAHDTYIDEGGRLVIVFDDLAVRKILGHTNTDWRDLRLMIADLIGTVISVWSESDDPEIFSILDRYQVTALDAKRVPGQKQAKLKSITYSEGFVENLLEKQGQLFINKTVITKILSLKNQVSRSAARFMLSHKGDQHHGIEEVFGYLGFKGAKSQMYEYLQQIQQDKEVLKELGIDLGSGMLHSVRNHGVFFQLPFDMLQAKQTKGFPVKTGAIPVKTGASKEVIH